MRYFTFTNPLIYVFCFVSCFLTLNAQIYVDIDATGNNDGSSWADAYTDLQDALVSANPGDDIWITIGTYKPSAYPPGCSGCLSPADYTFFVKDGVSLYGDFNGTETSLDERGDAEGFTILDGNIPDSGPVTNVNHVVVIYANGSNTRIQNLVITGGNASGLGGGVSIFGESVSAANGGGVYAIGQFGGSPSSKVIIADNDITLNLASNNGGGVYIDNVPTSLDLNSIYENEANNNGGGVYSSSLDGNSTIVGNSIYQNRATNDSGGPNYGGGLYVTGFATHLIDGNTIAKNEADFGAGICMDNSSVTLLENGISENKASLSGGGIYGLNTNYTLFRNGVFSNIAFDRGGGILFDSCSGEIINNTITSNFSADISNCNDTDEQCIDGAFQSYSNPDINYNKPEIFFSGGSSTFINNIVWGFGDGISGTNVTASNSIIKGGFPGPNILDEDPMFIFQPKLNSLILSLSNGSGVLGLQSASPAIDWGDTAIFEIIAGQLNIDTSSYIVGQSIDSGAFEQRGNKFILAPNGVTCLCPDAEIGESGTLVIGGFEKTFTKISEEDLYNLALGFQLPSPDPNQDLPNLELFCTSGITDMSGLFADNITGSNSFNQDISSWDVSTVTNMDNMFNGATAFNQDISDWCVEQITSEPNNFSINSPLQNSFKPNWGGDCTLSNFNVAPNGVTCLCPSAAIGESGLVIIDGVYKTFTKRSRAQLDALIANNDNDPRLAFTCTTGITDMSNLFGGASSFNKDISSWDVSSVTNMDNMFRNATTFNQDISFWDVSNVTSVSAMFKNASFFNQPLNDWDVSNVTEMGGMFDQALAFNQPLNSWDVSSANNMNGMFLFAEAFNQPLNDWDVSEVTNMSSMFRNASLFNNDISSWCVDTITSEPVDFSSNSPLQSNFKPLWGTCPDFVLASNGVTCLCPNANLGESGSLVIGGVSKTFTKRDRTELLALIANDQADPEIALTCTSGITDMSNVFLNRTTFNQNISSWDVSNVTNMQQMFRGASAFNQPLNDWDVSNVINMSIMFFDAIAFNQPLNDWNVSNVTNMSAMFQDTEVFNQPLNNWNVANVTNMNGMFYDAPVYNYPLDNWNVSSVTNMRFMFGGFDFQTTFNQPLNNWDVSQVTDMTGMFRNNIGFNQPIDNWDVSSVTNMSFMFFDATSFDQSLNDWDVSQVTDMSGMFQDAEVFNQPLNNWNVANVTNMFAMFFDAPAFNHPLDNWDVSNVTNMNSMFGGFDFQTTFNQPLNNWDVSKVTNMGSIFQNNINFNQPLHDWNVSLVTDMSYMFFGASVFNQDISRWCVENITSEPVGFSSNSPLQSSFKPLWGTCTLFFLDPNGVTCSCLNADFGDSGTLVIGGISKTFTKRTRAQLDALIANDQADPQIALTCTSGITDMSNLFLNKTLFNQDISSWDVSSVINMQEMFRGASTFNQPLNDWDVSQVTDMSGMFQDAEVFNQPLNNWNVANVTNMNGMFFDAPVFNHPLDNWDVSNVTDMRAMFGGFDFQTTFNQPLINWDVSNVTDMAGMFQNNINFNRPLNDWDVSSVTNMSFMFYDAPFFDHPLVNWDVSNVTNMRAMFSGFDFQTTFNHPLNNWDVSQVTDMTGMFQSNSYFNQPLSDWDVSSVIDMSSMFRFAFAFNQDISSWCVQLIPSEPSNFALFSPIQNNTGFKPNWGTCPSFVLSSNGVTCLCPNAAIGESGTLIINGVSKTFTKQDKAGITALLNADENNPLIALTCTSGITDMSILFANKTSFNQDISSWDTSSVTTMFGMFFDAPAFNQPLDNWDTSNVTNMRSMFERTSSFNQSLNDWDTSSVTDMFAMFVLATAFNQPLNNWDTSSVTTMQQMFAGANAFNQPLNNWDVSSVNDMFAMFVLATAFNQPLNNWDTSSVTTMQQMFAVANAFNQPLNNWDVSSVTDMSFMFYDVPTFDSPIGDWDVSSVTNMSGMFLGFDFHTTFNQPINNWDVSQVTNMAGMFQDNIHFNRPLNDWDVSSVTDMSFMFYDALAFDSPIDNWDVSSVTNMSGMFAGFDFQTTFNQPINNWDVSQVTDMVDMFRDNINFNQPLNDWDVSSVTDMSFMFFQSPAFDRPIDNWDVSSVTNMSGMFGGFDFQTTFNQPLNNWDVSQVTNMAGMFQNNFDFNQPLNDWDVSSVTNMLGMFAGAITFNSPLNNWNVSQVTDMTLMFAGGFLLTGTTFNQPLNNWDVSQVTNMTGMFRINNNFNQPLNDWNVSSVTDMNFMFSGADTFNQDISNWCVENITGQFDNFSTFSILQFSFKPFWGQPCINATWLGTEDSDWNNATNWKANSLPIATDNIAINTKSNSPLIDALTQVEVNNLIVLDATSIDVSGVLKVNNIFHNNGHITFKSDSNGSGQIDEFNGVITALGEITTERFIPAGDNNKRAYRLLTSAVNSTGSIYENWQENGSTPSSPDGLGTHITGGLASDGFDQSGSNNPSMFIFDNSNSNSTTSQTDDWSSIPNTNIKTLSAGEPYLTFIRGDRSIDITTNSATPSNTALRATGYLHTGSITYSVGNPVSYLNLSGEDEFYSLIGNPYQAVVDFNAATKSGLTDFIYVWDASVAGANGRGGYVTVDVTGNTTPPNPFSSDANQYIAPGMSFFVQNDNNSGTSASLTFDEDDKMTDETEITVFNTYPHFYINSRLYETLELQNGNTESDAIGLRFSDTFTTIADDEDATKLFNPGENYAIINNGLRSIDKQGIPAIGDQIDLTIINYEESNYSLTFVMENKPTGLGVFIVDNYLNTQTELTESFVYDFAVDANIPESTASDRFSLIFDNTTLGFDENTFGEGFSLFPNPAKDGQFSIKTPNLSGEVKVKLNNIMGQIVLNETLTIVGSEVNVNANNLASGVYIVELSQDEKTFSTKLIVE